MLLLLSLMQGCATAYVRVRNSDGSAWAAYGVSFFQTLNIPVLEIEGVGTVTGYRQGTDKEAVAAWLKLAAEALVK